MTNLTSSLTVKLIDDVSAPARSVSQALKDAEKNVKNISKALSGTGATDRFTNSLSKLKLTSKDIDQVSRAWKDYAKNASLAQNASSWTTAQARGVRQWEHQTVAALRAVNRERQAQARAEARAAKAAGGAYGVNAYGGAALASRAGLLRTAGGLAVAYGIHKGGEAAADRVHERVRMSASGMSASEVREAEAKAAEISKQFPSISVTESMHMLRNTRSIVGSLEEAGHVVEGLAKLRVIAQGARPGADVSEDFDQLVKGLEIKGVTQNPKQFHDYMEGIAKGLNVFGDTLKPSQYYEMFKYGRQATAGLSEKFILGTAPTLSQELGGQSYGQAVASFNRAIVGNRMNHSALREMARLGLIAPEDLDKTKTGSVKGLKPGRQIHGADLAQSDPNEWVKQYLIPALSKFGFRGNDEIGKEISRLFSDRTAAQMVQMLATQQSRIDKDMALLAHAPGLSAAADYMRNDPKIAFTGLKSSIESLAGTLGSAAMKGLAPAMSAAAEAIGNYTDRLTRYLKSNEEKKPGEVPEGQRNFNRIMNGIFGIDSDQPYFSDANKFKRADRDVADATEGFGPKKKRLAELQEELDKQKALRDKGMSRVSPWFRTRDEANAPSRVARLQPQVDALRAEVDHMQSVVDAHSARIDAQKRILEFQRSLPRDMSGHEDVHAVVPAGPGKFGFNKSGWGSYDPETGIPKIKELADTADQAKEKLDGLNTTVSPQVNDGSLKGVLGLLQSINAELAKANGGAATLRAGLSNMPSVKMPALGPAQRGSFSTNGVTGAD